MRQSAILTQEQVFEAVCSAIKNAIDVGNVELKPSTLIFKVLDVSQADWLDIIFRLQRDLGIEIPVCGMIPKSIFELLEVGKIHKEDDRFNQYTIRSFVSYLRELMAP